MAQSGDITCPECNTPNRASDPFCENCGYRLGRPETAYEGYQAIPKELARRARDRRGVNGETQTERDPVQFDRPATQPERLKVVPREGAASADKEAGGETAPDGHRAVTNAATIREHPPIEEGTLVEGLAPVSPTPATMEPKTEKNPTYEPSTFGETRMEEAVEESREIPTSPKGQPAIVHAAEAHRHTEQHEDGLSRSVLGLLWVASLGIAITATWYIASDREATDPVGDGFAVAPAKVEVPAGKFEAGLDEKVRSLILLSCQKMAADPNEECDQDKLLGGEFPEREVDLPAFEIDNAEVTVADYQACVKDGACPKPAWDDCKVYTHQGYQFALRVPKALKAPGVPMTCVTRAEASAYCSFRGGSLPTNDQWEKAARGTDGRMFPWGNNWASNLGNWGEQDIFRTPVVGELDGFPSVALPGQFPDGKSPFGLFDTSRNVAEWVADGDDGIARGGAWTSQPFDLRVTGRFELDPETRRTDVGFRCAY
jgi:formylglycine-generating enzyme required for sulfatase activity